MNKKEKVASRYDKWTYFYDLVDNFPLVSRPQRRWREDAVEYLDLQGDEEVLDLGAASGRLLPDIAQEIDGGRVLGSDISRKMIERANGRLSRTGLSREKARAVYDDIEDSKFPDDQFDRIIATFTFTTLPDPKKAASECARILKPDGKMIVLDTGKPQSIWVRPFFFFMMLSGKVFGRTHMDRDIHSVLKEHFTISEKERNMAGMVYILNCELEEK